MRGREVKGGIIGDGVSDERVSKGKTRKKSKSNEGKHLKLKKEENMREKEKR